MVLHTMLGEVGLEQGTTLSLVIVTATPILTVDRIPLIIILIIFINLINLIPIAALQLPSSDSKSYKFSFPSW